MAMYPPLIFLLLIGLLILRSFSLENQLLANLTDLKAMMSLPIPSIHAPTLMATFPLEAMGITLRIPPAFYGGIRTPREPLPVSAPLPFFLYLAQSSRTLLPTPLTPGDPLFNFSPQTGGYSCLIFPSPLPSSTSFCPLSIWSHLSMS